MKRRKKKNEQQIINVLNYQSRELRAIEMPDQGQVKARITETEELLKDLGYSDTLESLKHNIQTPQQKRLMVLPSWDELCAEAERVVGTKCELESIFTDDELKENEIAAKQMEEEFNALHQLDRYDVAISAVAGILGAVMDILLVGIPEKTKEGLKAGKLADYVREWFDERYPEDEMSKLAHSKESKVPYDAQDNRHTTIRVEGLSAYYHRLLSLGHDPLLGFVVGVIDIVSGSMTTIDKAGKYASQVMENYADRKESDVFLAIAKQLIHLKTDVTTSMGLPVPLMGLFNLMQFGSIGEAEQTIAELVQGMYFEGYDFVHFCAMSIPTMIIEATIRIGYAIKRIKEGHSIKESIPFSLDREKHPKLVTMLFIGHSAAAAANAGKIAFAKNPMAISYTQWLAFAKYSFLQLKWGIIEKPELRDAYVGGKINEELQDLYREINVTLSQLQRRSPEVFEGIEMG